MDERKAGSNQLANQAPGTQKGHREAVNLWEAGHSPLSHEDVSEDQTMFFCFTISFLTD